jgi:hypothetical protein
MIDVICIGLLVLFYGCAIGGILWMLFDMIRRGTKTHG